MRFSCNKIPHLQYFKDLVYHRNTLQVQMRSTLPEIKGTMLDKNGVGGGPKLPVFLFLSVSESNGKGLQPP